MPPAKDITGQTFGELTAVQQSGRNKHGKVIWLCRCTCGKNCHVLSHCLIQGHTRSCGCRTQQWKAAKCKTHGHLAGQDHKQPPEYRSWASMIQRCTNVKNSKYADYGGRGIKICERWRNSFAAFYEDMGPRPEPNYTLERRDNEGNYCPENCCWATRKTQGSNKRNNVLLAYDGKCLTLAEWARELDISYLILFKRLRRGWPIEKALTTPPRR